MDEARRGTAFPRFAHMNSARHLIYVGALSLAMPALGTIGHMLLEGWSALDAFCMTIVPVTAVGHSEVGPPSPAGRLYAILVGSFYPVLAFSSTSPASSSWGKARSERSWGEEAWIAKSATSAATPSSAAAAASAGRRATNSEHGPWTSSSSRNPRSWRM
ncbi:MAG: ion channel [Desulfococcaceae bacterium]